MHSREQTKDELSRTICEALQSLRESHPIVPARTSDKAFMDETGIAEGTAKSVEKCARGHADYTPDTYTIHKWVTGCKSTLSRFYEGIEGKREKRPGRTPPGYEPYFQLLTEIIESGGLHYCLMGLLAAAKLSKVTIPENLETLLDPDQRQVDPKRKKVKTGKHAAVI